MPIRKRNIIILLILLAAVFVAYRGSQLLSSIKYAKEISEEEVLQHTPHPDPKGLVIKVPILIYHNVRPDYPSESRSEKSFSITPEMLEAQFAYLRENGYTVISMDQLATDIEVGTTSPIQKPVVLTFDDGWQSQFTYALPLLRKYHYTATFYIYTNAIGTNPSSMTWSELQALHAQGMKIGDHTESHPHLSGLANAQLETEILGGKSLLEQHLHIHVVHFASPYGYSNIGIEDLLKANGFVTGRTTYKGVKQSNDNQFALRGYLVKRSMPAFTDYLQGS